MVCKDCKKKISVGSTFCPHCGSELTSVSQEDLALRFHLLNNLVR